MTARLRQIILFSVPALACKPAVHLLLLYLLRAFSPFIWGWFHVQEASSASTDLNCLLSKYICGLITLSSLFLVPWRINPRTKANKGTICMNHRGTCRSLLKPIRSSRSQTHGWEFYIIKFHFNDLPETHLLWQPVCTCSRMLHMMLSRGCRVEESSFMLWQKEGKSVREHHFQRKYKIIETLNWFIATLMPAGFKNKPLQDSESFAS